MVTLVSHFHATNSIKALTGGFLTHPTDSFYTADKRANCNNMTETKLGQMGDDTVTWTNHRCSSISDFLILQLSQLYKHLCRWMLNFQHLQNSCTIIGYCHILLTSRTITVSCYFPITFVKKITTNNIVIVIIIREHLYCNWVTWWTYVHSNSQRVDILYGIIRIIPGP